MIHLKLYAWIIKDMKMEVKNTTINNWITINNVNTIINNINTIFFNKNGIHFDVEIKEINLSDNATQIKTINGKQMSYINFIEQLNRDLDKFPNKIRKEAYISLIGNN